MPLYYDEETKTYGPSKSVDQLTETTWAGVVSCGGNETKLKEYYKKCKDMKEQILKTMEKEGRPKTIAEYNKVRKRLFFS